MDWWRRQAKKTKWSLMAVTALIVVVALVAVTLLVQEPEPSGNSPTATTARSLKTQPSQLQAVISHSSPTAAAQRTASPAPQQSAEQTATATKTATSQPTVVAAPSKTKTAVAKATSPASQQTAPSGTKPPASRSTANGPAPDGDVPVRLVIDTPSMQVNADVEQLGLTATNAMQAPSGWWNVGWYKLGFKPGQVGNAVIAGHLDSYTGPAVFWNLKDLQAGDIVSVVDSNGKTLHFRVTGTQSYQDSNAPIAAIFGPSDGRHLNLITCDGVWDSSTGAYTKRLVVFTELVTQ